MPLQWLPLQQRQQQARQPIRSPVSEALTPRPKGISGEGVAARWEREEAAAAERKFQEKMMKLQHEQGMEKLRFTAGLREDAAKGITTGQAFGQAPEAAPTAAAMLKEEDIPKAADELFKFIQTLPEEQQIFFLRELQNPTGGSYMTSAGKTVVTTKKNPLFEELINKRYVLPKEDGTYSWATPIREFEKGTFEITDKGVFNTATGKIIAKPGDVPTDWGVVYTEVLAEGLKHVDEMLDVSWMQTMDTAEMGKHIETKKTEYRDWIASRLFSRGMTDKDKINRLADLAIGSYDWQKHLDEAKAREEGTAPPPTPPPTETNRGLPLNEEVVSSLKQLFKDNPGELDIIEQYKDEYGEVNVNKALEKEVKPTPITPPPKPLPTKEKKVGRWDVLMETIRERR